MFGGSVVTNRRHLLRFVNTVGGGQERLKLLKLHLVRVTEGGAAPSSLSLPDSGRGSEGKRRSDRSRECFHLARPVGGRLRGDKLFLSVCCATRQRRANGGKKYVFFGGGSAERPYKSCCVFAVAKREFRRSTHDL